MKTSKSNLKTETTAEFLARGGKVNKLASLYNPKEDSNLIPAWVASQPKGLKVSIIDSYTGFNKQGGYWVNCLKN